MIQEVVYRTLCCGAVHGMEAHSLLETIMAKPEELYQEIIVETYYESGSGLHGDIHVRCIEGQPFPTHLRVRFPRAVRQAHKVPTRFRVAGKLSDREGGNEFIHTNHAWGYHVEK